MAKKKKNWCRAKVFGENMTMEIEGTILGCMQNMLLMMPEHIQLKAAESLVQYVDEAAKRREAKADQPEVQP